MRIAPEMLIVSDSRQLFTTKDHLSLMSGIFVSTRPFHWATCN